MFNLLFPPLAGLVLVLLLLTLACMIRGSRDRPSETYLANLKTISREREYRQARDREQQAYWDYHQAG